MTKDCTLEEIPMVSISDFTMSFHADERKKERIDILSRDGYSIGNPFKMFKDEENKGYLLTDKGIIYVLDLKEHIIITIMVSSRSNMRRCFAAAGQSAPYNLLNICSLHEEEYPDILKH